MHSSILQIQRVLVTVDILTLEQMNKMWHFRVVITSNMAGTTFLHAGKWQTKEAADKFARGILYDDETYIIAESYE